MAHGFVSMDKKLRTREDLFSNCIRIWERMWNLKNKIRKSTCFSESLIWESSYLYTICETLRRVLSQLMEVLTQHSYNTNVTNLTEIIKLYVTETKVILYNHWTEQR